MGEPLDIDHAATAHLDTPKERALRIDYDLADLEVQQLKATLKRVRMIPLSEEAEEMFKALHRVEQLEALVRRLGFGEML